MSLTRFQQAEVEFNVTPECEQLMHLEKDDTKKYLIKQACIGTQQNAYQITQQHKTNVWAEAHEKIDLEQFDEIKTSIAPIVSAWKTIMSVKGVLMTIFTATAGAVLVALIVHWLNLK